MSDDLHVIYDSVKVGHPMSYSSLFCNAAFRASPRFVFRNRCRSIFSTAGALRVLTRFRLNGPFFHEVARTALKVRPGFSLVYFHPFTALGTAAVGQNRVLSATVSAPAVGADEHGAVFFFLTSFSFASHSGHLLPVKL